MGGSYSPNVSYLAAINDLMMNNFIIGITRQKAWRGLRLFLHTAGLKVFTFNAIRSILYCKSDASKKEHKKEMSATCAFHVLFTTKLGSTLLTVRVLERSQGTDGTRVHFVYVWGGIYINISQCLQNHT